MAQNTSAVLWFDIFVLNALLLYYDMWDGEAALKDRSLLRMIGIKWF